MENLVIINPIKIISFPFMRPIIKNRNCMWNIFVSTKWEKMKENECIKNEKAIKILKNHTVTDWIIQGN